MPHVDVRLALIDASELCAREAARRVRGDVLKLDSDQLSSSDWFGKADAVAFLGGEVDLAISKRCLEAGKHVLVSAEACRARSVLDGLAEQQQRVSPASLQVGNPIASLPSRELIWEQCQQGKLGAPGLFRVHRWGATTREPESPQSSLSPDLLCEIDSVLRFFRDSPQRVFATEYGDRRGCAVHLAWADGPAAMIDWIRQLAAAGNTYASFSVIGSSGSAYADDHPNAQILIQEQPVALTVPEACHCHLPMIMRFLAGISAMDLDHQPFGHTEAKRSGCDSLNRWRQTLVIADAIAESIRTHLAVEPVR